MNENQNRLLDIVEQYIRDMYAKITQLDKHKKMEVAEDILVRLKLAGELAQQLLDQHDGTDYYMVIEELSDHLFSLSIGFLALICVPLEKSSLQDRSKGKFGVSRNANSDNNLMDYSEYSMKQAEEDMLNFKSKLTKKGIIPSKPNEPESEEKPKSKKKTKKTKRTKKKKNDDEKKTKK